MSESISCDKTIYVWTAHHCRLHAPVSGALKSLRGPANYLPDCRKYRFGTDLRMSENTLFNQSYRRLFGDGVGLHKAADGFFQRFYYHFLQDAEISGFFRNTDMSRQISMLRKSFFHIAAFYVTSAPSAELERIALIHHKLGIAQKHYDRWLDALVETVKEQDEECDLATELAWRWALAPGLTYMKLFAHLSTA